MAFPPAAVIGFAFGASELSLGRWRRSSAVKGEKSADGGTLGMLWMVAMASICGGLVVALRPLGPHLPTGYPWRAASVTIFVLGTVLRWWSIIHLGRFFTVDVAVANDHRVIDTGPYRVLRHPSYTGLIMQYAGWALSLNNVLAVTVVLVPVCVSLLYRIRIEEAALLAALGESYTAYSARTKRLVPMVY